MKKIPLLLATSALLYSANSLAAPQIGFKPGTGDPSFAFADLWNNETDSALSVGFQPATQIPPNTPYETTLISQSRVASLSKNGTVLSIAEVGCELNVNCEITKVLKFKELVVSNDGSNATFVEAAGQGSGPPELKIYFDPTPNANPNTATGYDDGKLILTAQLIQATSSFAASGAIGTGSFDLRFRIDFADPDYIDLGTNDIIGETITGTTNVPTFFTPANMWDGTTTAGNLLLKVDSSQSFSKKPTNVPEPLSLFLGMIALVSLGAIERLKSK